MSRICWDDLPAAVHSAVTAYTGPIYRVRSASAGNNSAIATHLETAGGSVFVKGIRSDHAQVWTQAREVAINPYVRSLAPRLLWQINTDGWNLLGFEHIDGRHADYTPGSVDLPKVAHAVRELARVPCPDIPLKRLDKRLAEFAGDGVNLDLLKGDDLLHSDWAPDNVLINEQTVHIIDWAWPTRGPAWADIAILIVRLMEAGHTATEADEWARGEFPAWNTASRDAISTLAEAKLRLWKQIVVEDPQPWKQHMANVAQQWAHHTRA